MWDFIFLTNLYYFYRYNSYKKKYFANKKTVWITPLDQTNFFKLYIVQREHEAILLAKKQKQEKMLNWEDYKSMEFTLSVIIFRS